MGKHKKDKKEKKDHKKKKDKKRSRDDSRIRNPREGDSLLEVAAEAIASYPTLLDELPPIIASIDRGSIESIESFNDSRKREVLKLLFKKLQVVEYDAQNKGWRRISANIKVHKIIAHDFLTEDHSRLAKSTHQSLAPGVAFALVLFFPDIILELPSLLEQLLDGQVVQVDGIDNLSLRQGLQTLLKVLRCSHEDSGYSMDSSSGVKLMIKILKAYSKEGGQRSIKFSSRKEEPSRAPIAEAEDDSSSDEDDGISSEGSSSPSHHHAPQSEDVLEEIESNTEEPAVIAGRVLGPQLPSDLSAMAAQYSHHLGSSDYDDGDDEDDDGPQPAAPGWVGPSANSAALGLTAVTLYKDDKQSSTDVTDEQSMKREEWIAEPGESKALKAMVGGEGALFSLPRKFQTGKQAKKKAEDMAIQREYLKKVAAQREDAALGGRVREEEVPVEKAPSLLQEHLQKRARREEDGSAAQRPKERLPFDRERDVLSHKKMSQADVLRLAENARELESKFDKAAVQKTFL